MVQSLLDENDRLRGVADARQEKIDDLTDMVNAAPLPPPLSALGDMGTDVDPSAFGFPDGIPPPIVDGEDLPPPGELSTPPDEDPSDRVIDKDGMKDILRETMRVTWSDELGHKSSCFCLFLLFIMSVSALCFIFAVTSKTDMTFRRFSECVLFEDELVSNVTMLPKPYSILPSFYEIYRRNDPDYVDSRAICCQRYYRDDDCGHTIVKAGLKYLFVHYSLMFSIVNYLLSILVFVVCAYSLGLRRFVRGGYFHLVHTYEELPSSRAYFYNHTSTDLRADSVAQQKVKHGNPLISTFVYSTRIAWKQGRVPNATEESYFSKLFRKCFTWWMFHGYETEVELNASKEMISQIATSASFSSFRNSEEIVADRLAFAVSKLQSVNHNRYRALYGDQFVQNSAIIAYGIYKQYQHNYANVLPFPIPLA